MIIAASGNVGSGKTTLAKFLVKNYGFVYVPSNKMYSSFINDFFDNKKEYFLPTQLSFLITKATEITNLKKVIFITQPYVVLLPNNLIYMIIMVFLNVMGLHVIIQY